MGEMNVIDRPNTVETLQASYVWFGLATYFQHIRCGFDEKGRF